MRITKIGVPESEFVYEDEGWNGEKQGSAGTAGNYRLAKWPSFKAWDGYLPQAVSQFFFKNRDHLSRHVLDGIRDQLSPLAGLGSLSFPIVSLTHTGQAISSLIYTTRRARVVRLSKMVDIRNLRINHQAISTSTLRRSFVETESSAAPRKDERPAACSRRRPTFSRLTLVC